MTDDGDADEWGRGTDHERRTKNGADDEPETERPTKEESAIGRFGAKVLTTIPKPLLGIRGTLFKRMAIKSLENYHKAAGGDAVAINAKAGQKVEFEPVEYQTPEEVDEGERPGWHVKGRDKVWNPASEGGSVNYLGRTPVVNLEDDEHVEAGWLAPRVGHAIELDNYRPIFTNPTMNAVVDAPVDANGAVADGGMNANFELEFPGHFSGDNVIDLDSGDGYDGMRISASKAREWQAETADSEQMQLQDDRAYIRGLAQGEEGPNVVRLFLYAALLVIGVLAVVLLGPQLVGGASGGGINPLMLGVMGSLL